MTANELADGILAIEERIFLTKKEHQLFQNSATMLRQQQAEIEALKKEAALQRLSDFTQEAEKTLTPLTDEEIEIECRKAWNLNDQYRLNLEEVIRFAHTILRKANEK